MVSLVDTGFSFEVTQVFTGKWIDKPSVVFTCTGRWFGLEKKGGSDKVWMRLEDNVLSEISQLQKDKYMHDSISMRSLDSSEA